MSSGIIAPHDKCEVQIIQKPMKLAGPVHSHRFLIQAIPTMEKDQTKVREVWQKADKEAVQERRLGVQFSDNFGKQQTKHSQYQELLKYVESLEKRKDQFLAERNSPAKATKTQEARGFTLIQVVLIVIAAMLVAKLHNMLTA